MCRCKEIIIEKIDEAIGANYSGSVCDCGKPETNGNICNYCKIKEALMMSRSCIIISIGKIATMRLNIVEVQKEIERKLKKLMEV